MSTFRPINNYKGDLPAQTLAIRAELDLPASARMDVEFFDFHRFVGVAFDVDGKKAAFKTNFSDGWDGRIVEQAKVWLSE